ncbi:RadC family protein [Vibrio aerogenes]|uniref:RadC family protein n=1 Tax=Vibrio aerogenes TaxID=92172 RepID=UPI0021C324E8|nr:DNA repair protein RadC [Vibrio aerogenes]
MFTPEEFSVLNSFSPSEKALFNEAAALISVKSRTNRDVFNTAEFAKRFCQYKIVHYEQEVFCLLLLDNQHRLIEFVELFHGTINRASVYPREIVKEVLKHNAAAVILTHNHPSGVPEPSHSDRRVTQQIVQILTLIETRVCDHIVVSTGGCVSFSERGWI